MMDHAIPRLIMSCLSIISSPKKQLELSEKIQIIFEAVNTSSSLKV